MSHDSHKDKTERRERVKNDEKKQMNSNGKEKKWMCIVH